MITHRLDKYEDLAVRLPDDPGALSAITTRLRDNIETYPLFDTARMTRHLEWAYTRMWERSQHGEPPDHFAVPRLP